MRNKPNFRRTAYAQYSKSGAFVRNKANFDGSRTGTKPFAGKELCGMYPSRRFGKTKPIPGTVPIGRSAFPGAIVQNKPNSRRSLSAGGRSTKQTQFLPDRMPPHRSTIPSFQYSKPRLVVRNKANSARPHQGEGRARGAIVRNKPNLIRVGLEISYLQEKSYVVCTCLSGPAKQSQFQKEFQVRSVKCEDGEFSIRSGESSCLGSQTDNSAFEDSSNFTLPTPAGISGGEFSPLDGGRVPV